MAQFLLRMGNGNDGNWPSARIEMGKDDCPYSFMECVIPNGFIPSHRARSYAWQNVYTDGEADHGLYATLSENYNGATEMGAAYKTAELRPLAEGEDYSELGVWTPQEWLDRGARVKYNQKRKK